MAAMLFARSAAAVHPDRLAEPADIHKAGCLAMPTELGPADDLEHFIQGAGMEGRTARRSRAGRDGGRAGQFGGASSVVPVATAIRRPW
jgi:hypothetical protein